MVKLWISDKLELRWNEWPNRDDFDSSTEYRYLNELAKAKEESILVVDQDGFICVNNSGTPNTFVDFPIELEDGWQCNYRNQGWENCPKGLYDEYVAQSVTDKIRRVARLKPVNSAITKVMKNIPPGKLDQHYKGEPRGNSAHGYSEGAEFSSDSTKVFLADTGMWFPEKQIEDLKSKLDAANKRIKELENESVDLITAPSYPRGLKARILEAFCREYDGESMAYAMLIKVLDELGIK